MRSEFESLRLKPFELISSDRGNKTTAFVVNPCHFHLYFRRIVKTHGDRSLRPFAANTAAFRTSQLLLLRCEIWQTAEMIKSPFFVITIQNLTAIERLGKNQGSLFINQELMDFPYSILDLAIIRKDADAADAYQRSLDLAQKAEGWGYKRFWLAEHHNMSSVGSSAPMILMGNIAGGTTKIRVGSGGIMLPNHSPLMVAEQIGTLETLYPGRIDLGLGRAPGTDQKTASALRRGRMETVNDFPKDLEELQLYFSLENSRSEVRAFPAEGLDVPIYLLGSSMSSAVLAAEKGLPYVFASHFAPTYFVQAVKYYQSNFKPSEQLKEPYVIACVNVIAAETDVEAQFLSTSFYQMALGIIRGKSYPLMPPVMDMSTVWTEQEAAAIQNMMAVTYVGSKENVAAGLEDLIKFTGVNELMITTNIYDHEARLKSFQITAEVMNDLRNVLVY